jgi:hypothetical protein
MGTNPNILQQLEEDPKNWMLKLPGQANRPSLGLPQTGTTPAFNPAAPAPRLGTGLSLSAPPATTPQPTQLPDPNAPKQLSLPAAPDPNDPKLQGPHGFKRVMLTLGSAMLGGPAGDAATRALHPYDTAEERYRKQLADADTASQIADRQRQANLPAPRLPMEHATPGEAVRDPNDPNAQWQTPAPAKPDKPEPPVRLAPGEEAVDPVTGKVIASLPGKPDKAPTPTFEEQEYSDWATAEKAKNPGADTSRVAFEKMRKTATDKPPEPPHALMVDPATGKAIDVTPGSTVPRGATTVLEAGKQQTAADSKAAAQQYADDYLAKKQFTGAGDEALMEKYFELAKPSSGFRMTQPQIEMLTMARDLMGGMEAKAKHLFSPNAPYFSDTQRQQIVETMKNIGAAGDEARGGMVTMKAPNGQTKQVPASQIDHYKSLGAVQVQ